MARWTRSTSRWTAAACCALLLAAPSRAPAQAAKVSTKKVDPDEVKARGLFKEGQTAYDVGDFKLALEKYGEAYKVKPLPGFLFNLGQCQRQLGNYKEASFFFGRFIENSKPEAANVEVARELLADVDRRAQAQDEAREAEEKRKADEAAKPPADAPRTATLEPRPPEVDLPPPPPPPVEEAPVYKKGWFWGVIAGSVAVVAGGVVGGYYAFKPRVLSYTPTTTTLPDIDARSTK